jgi:hypothetical protein
VFFFCLIHEKESSNECSFLFFREVKIFGVATPLRMKSLIFAKLHYTVLQYIQERDRLTISNLHDKCVMNRYKNM